MPVVNLHGAARVESLTLGVHTAIGSSFACVLILIWYVSSSSHQSPWRVRLLPGVRKIWPQLRACTKTTTSYVACVVAPISLFVSALVHRYMVQPF